MSLPPVPRDIAFNYPREILDLDEATEALFTLAESAESKYAPPYATLYPAIQEVNFASLAKVEPERDPPLHYTGAPVGFGRPQQLHVTPVQVNRSRARQIGTASVYGRYMLLVDTLLADLPLTYRNWLRSHGHIFVSSLEDVVRVANLPVYAPIDYGPDVAISWDLGI